MDAVRSKLASVKEIRVCTLNIGMFAGMAEEHARFLRKSCIDICALQKTRLCGANN